MLTWIGPHMSAGSGGQKMAKPGVAVTELCPIGGVMKKSNARCRVTLQVKHIKCNTMKSSENYHVKVQIEVTEEK